MTPEYFLTLWLISSLCMAGLFCLYRRGLLAAWVDVVWTSGIGVIATFSYFLFHQGSTKALIVYLCILLWSIRLSHHLVIRIQLHGEDARYKNLEFKWGEKSAPKMMFGVFMLQAFWCTTFASLPVMAMANTGNFSIYDAIGLAVYSIAFLGESIADRQLKKFKDLPKNKQGICTQGLWSWSRHPNYFFEWLHWWAYVAFLIGSPQVVFGILITMFMYYLINKVTGIPPTEERMIATRREAYRIYQLQTSRFFLFPPKKKVIYEHT